MSVRLDLGDSRELLAAMEPNSVDAIVTDPPYEINFMGSATRGWDNSGISYDPAFWALCLRVLKPGGHLVSFGACRTYHRIACAIEDGGFEVRDCLQWIFGTGMPKNANVPWLVDRHLGHDRDSAAPPITDEAKGLVGIGTALKPSYEPISLARKPLAGTVAATVLEYGTGGLNVDGCRVGDEARHNPAAANKAGGASLNMSARGMPITDGRDAIGRWPPNVLLSPEASAKLGDQAAFFPVFDWSEQDHFFYSGKASRAEREAGCEHLPAKTQAETVDREPGAPGCNNPRAGAGRENGKGAGVKVRNFHPT